MRRGAAAKKGGHMSGNGGHPLRVGVPVGIRIYTPLSLSDTFFASRRIFLAWRLPAYARMTRRPPFPPSGPQIIPESPSLPWLIPPLIALRRSSRGVMWSAKVFISNIFDFDEETSPMGWTRLWMKRCAIGHAEIVKRGVPHEIYSIEYIYVYVQWYTEYFRDIGCSFNHEIFNNFSFFYTTAQIETI